MKYISTLHTIVKILSKRHRCQPLEIFVSYLTTSSPPPPLPTPHSHPRYSLCTESMITWAFFRKKVRENQQHLPPHPSITHTHTHTHVSPHPHYSNNTGLMITWAILRFNARNASCIILSHDKTNLLWSFICKCQRRDKMQARETKKL